MRLIGSFRKKSLKNAEKSTSEEIKTKIKEIKFTSSDLNPTRTIKKDRIGKMEIAQTKEMKKPRNSKNCSKKPRLNTNAA